MPAVTAELRQMASRWFSELPSVVLGPGVKSGMPILYDNPKEVGADRIANAVGAHDLFGGPSVVFDLGTATTFAPRTPPPGGAARAPQRHRKADGGVDPVRRPLRVRRPGRRPVPAHRGRARP